MKEEAWFVYLIECSDGSIYTGISNNVSERILKHNSGKGAKYTRARRPVFLKAICSYVNKSEASKAEYAIKKYSRNEKMMLVQILNFCNKDVQSDLS